MSSARCFGLCALAISLSLSSLPAPASAEESLAAAVQRRVEGELLQPLSAIEATRSRFSRARVAPRERRVRVTQATTTLDPDGRAYVPFAVDVRFGSQEWNENDVVGCAYMNGGKLFVKRGEEYRPAEFLLGKSADPVAGVCVPKKQA